MVNDQIPLIVRYYSLRLAPSGIRGCRDFTDPYISITLNKRKFIYNCHNQLLHRTDSLMKLYTTVPVYCKKRLYASYFGKFSDILCRNSQKQPIQASFAGSRDSIPPVLRINSSASFSSETVMICAPSFCIFTSKSSYPRRTYLISDTEV